MRWVCIDHWKQAIEEQLELFVILLCYQFIKELGKVVLDEIQLVIVIELSHLRIPSHM